MPGPHHGRLPPPSPAEPLWTASALFVARFGLVLAVHRVLVFPLVSPVPQKRRKKKIPPLPPNVRDRRGRPTYLGYAQLGIASVGKNEGNGLTTKKSEVLISPNIHKNRATFKNEKEMTASDRKPKLR
jgi:hypothetical protein